MKKIYGEEVVAILALGFGLSMLFAVLIIIRYAFLR